MSTWKRPIENVSHEPTLCQTEANDSAMSPAGKLKHLDHHPVIVESACVLLCSTPQAEDATSVEVGELH